MGCGCGTATDIALELIRDLRPVTLTVGEALRKMRGKRRSADAISPLAYVYYGDVNARFTP